MNFPQAKKFKHHRSYSKNMMFNDEKYLMCLSLCLTSRLILQVCYLGVITEQSKNVLRTSSSSLPVAWHSNSRENPQLGKSGFRQQELFCIGKEKVVSPNFCRYTIACQQIMGFQTYSDILKILCRHFQNINKTKNGSESLFQLPNV